MAGATFGDFGASLFVANARFGGCSWQGQHSVILQHHFSWQAQRLVMLQRHATCDVGASPFVAGAEFGDVGL